MSMNRWRNLIMWRIPILRYFDYTTWLDADALLFAQGIDIFSQMHEAGAYLGNVILLFTLTLPSSC
jgi:hypothetical protein